jgi:cell division protease FtsH
MDDFNNAIERVVAGLEKRHHLLSPLERERVAWHEMGHALVAMSLPRTDPVHKVSIIPRGIGALGYTIQRPTEDRFITSQQELADRIAVLLAGRAAELLRFDDLSTGASDDIRKATDIARSMVMRFGMDPELGYVAYERQDGVGQFGQNLTMTDYGDSTADEIDRSVRDIITAEARRALEILEANQSILANTARELLERETLDEDDLISLTESLHKREDSSVYSPRKRLKSNAATRSPESEAPV